MQVIIEREKKTYYQGNITPQNVCCTEITTEEKEKVVFLRDWLSFSEPFELIDELWQQNVSYLGTDTTVKTQGQPHSRQMDYNTKNVEH